MWQVTSEACKIPDTKTACVLKLYHIIYVLVGFVQNSSTIFCWSKQNDREYWISWNEKRVNSWRDKLTLINFHIKNATKGIDVHLF